MICKNGFQIDPRNAEPLQIIKSPRTKVELCQFVHCCRWMSLSIPDFARRSAPLTKLLEKAFEKVGRRTKCSIKKISVSELSWEIENEEAYQSLQITRRKSTELAHPKKGYVICIHKAALDRFWAAVI